MASINVHGATSVTIQTTQHKDFQTVVIKVEGRDATELKIFSRETINLEIGETTYGSSYGSSYKGAQDGN